MYYKDKVIWITGASSGVGEALVYAFNKEQARLIISSHEPEELERVRNNCTFEKEKILVLPFDLSEHDKIPEIAEKGINQFKRIDILFHSGGVSQRALAQDTTIATDKKIMDINYFGTIILSKSILPTMIKQKSGHIAVMTSLAGKFEIPLRSAYAASKHALHGFFDTLRAETHQYGIKITLFCPAYIKTNIAVNALTGSGKAQNHNDPGAEKGTPPEAFARMALQAIKKGKMEVVSGGKEKYGVYIKRFFPRRFAKIIRKRDVR